MSTHSASDHEFARLFSPKILERLRDDAFSAGVHIYKSAPGGGKTTLLRAFTPEALRTFWHARRQPEFAESVQRLTGHGVIAADTGPQTLGVLLTCAAGYADLPPQAITPESGVFRALLNCRIVLRAIRGLAGFLGLASEDQLSEIRLSYGTTHDFGEIPRCESAIQMLRWAEAAEQRVYDALDVFVGNERATLPGHMRLAGVLWLQHVHVTFQRREVAPKRLLMLDDVQMLRRRQRSALLDELVVVRPGIPVWLAERTLASADEFLSQGARAGRDLHEHVLEELWSGHGGARQFQSFAQNILDRRMESQSALPAATFSACLRDQTEPSEIADEVTAAQESSWKAILKAAADERYRAWVERASTLVNVMTLDAVIELRTLRILLAREAARRQMTLGFSLSSEELDDLGSGAVRSAAELFLHEEHRFPLYFGIERVCIMASSNIEEMLSLAAALYVGLQARQVLRKQELVLSPREQERLLIDAARAKLEFIPKSHTEGSRARRLLGAMGSYCRARTFLPNAPYAPGVTGLRISASEANVLTADEPSSTLRARGVLRRVLTECVAENLLLTRESSASSSREAGTVYYLNRTLCAAFGLPLHFGGWQDVRVVDLLDWMERGRVNVPRQQEIP